MTKKKLLSLLLACALLLGFLPAAMPAEAAGPELGEPLSFTVSGDGIILYYESWNDDGTDLEYRLNGSGDWAEFPEDGVGIAADESIQLRGDNPNGFYTRFYAEGDGSYALSGNIMSLLDRDDYAELKTIPAGSDGCFQNCFLEMEGLTSAAELQLPATTLARACYCSMFESCWNLADAPALPATTLADICYGYMFQECDSLTTAPALPATTLADSCCYYMFQGCDSLTAAPVLPAAELANECYARMFDDCPNLSSVTAAFGDWNASAHATTGWLDGTAGQGSFLCTAELTRQTGSGFIPSGWTVEDVRFGVPYLAPVTDADGNVCFDEDGNVRFETREAAVCRDAASLTEWTDGWYVMVGEKSVNTVTVSGDVFLILADGCSLTAVGGSRKPGILVSGDGSSLTICGQSEGSGMVTANGNRYAAGIGGRYNGSGGNITINGGIVNATGGEYAAGIGGGRNDSGGGIGSHITINGGVVNAASNGYGAGIGGGRNGGGSDITINGGTVNATGGREGAGIGGGSGGIGENITINGGTVTAAGGVMSTNPAGLDGAGIGGGYDCGGENITINGGTVTAIGGMNAAGIGGAGNGGSSRGIGSHITINGGVVNATSSDRGAGIGGGWCGSGSDITVNGGTVTATGGSYSAGIGGGNGGSGENIAICGGAVTATGSEYAAGIGGGWNGGGIGITVSGGAVTATGGEDIADIGGGMDGSSENITVSGGSFSFDVSALTANGCVCLANPAYGSAEGALPYLVGTVRGIGYDVAVSDGAPTQYIEGIGASLEGVVPADSSAYRQFVGWYDAAEGGNAVTEIGTDAAGDIVLYARFVGIIAINADPADYEGGVGTRAVFTVSAEGADLRYQWQVKPGEKYDWRDTTITGCRTDTISVPITAARVGYRYRCVITDASGSTVTSEDARLTAPLTLLTDPADCESEIGENAVFTVSAAGDGLRYQWQVKPGDKYDWRDTTIYGCSTAKIRVPVTAARVGYRYRCVITDAKGETVTSGDARLTAPLTVTADPADYEGEIGENAVFTAAAEGAGLRYQWQVKPGDKYGWRDTTGRGCKTDTLTVPVTEARIGYRYRCVITDAAGETLTSGEARLIGSGS